jgi:L-ascorbate metabolism protein UlaG (beta-lactamase superfamily)
VNVAYIGHASFLWTASDGTRVLIDPYQEPDDGPTWFEGDFPEVEADLVASTHNHFDHNAVGMAVGSPALLTAPGEYETPGIRITSVPEVHAGKWVMPNSLAVVESGGVKFVHCGDNRFDVDPTVASAVGEVDVVIVAVDDSLHLMSRAEVWRLATTFSPRVIIPMHFLLPGVVTPSSTLLGIEDWLGSLPEGTQIRRIPEDEVTASSEDMPPRSEVPQAPAIWVFGAARAAGL